MTTLLDSAPERAENLRLEAMAHVRRNELEASLPLFDEALACASSDELSELITINKAGVLISMEITGPEIQQLPRIIMRRRNPRHLYLAAYNLRRKHQNARELDRAAFYGRVALEAAEEAENRESVANARIALGNICVFDSRPTDAIEHYEAALAISRNDAAMSLSAAFAMQNLGYCYLITDRTSDGIELIHSAITQMESCGAEGYLAESFIDLCHGYLDRDELDSARTWGERGLAIATEVRQIRNAHYLLGEVAYKSGDIQSAERHFGELSRFYPDFPHLKDLLFAIDLRSMVNFKL